MTKFTPEFIANLRRFELPDLTFEPRKHGDPHIHIKQYDYPLADVHNFGNTGEVTAKSIVLSCNILSDALDEIERLQAELDKNRWILVSERLPEITHEDGHRHSETVLVDWHTYCGDERCEDFGKTFVTVEKAFIVDDVWMRLDNAEEIEIGDDFAPTSWTPLPEPPEDEK